MKEEDKKQEEDYLYSLRNTLDNGAVIDTIHSKKEMIQGKNKQSLKNGLNL